jgi:ribosome-binding factor A
MTTHRHERLAEEIRQEVEVMLAGELKDPRLQASVSVTEVRLAPDLRQVRIFVVVAGSPDEQRAALQGFEAAAGYVRHELTERLRLRRSPEVLFLLDRSVEYGQRIDELLRQVKKTEDH